MLPVIALVGRPNVGKSTLFNRLTRTRDAIVADLPGLTRDRQYGEGVVGERPYIVIDTGGIGEEDLSIDSLMTAQSKQAMLEADIILFMVDGRSGLTAADEMIAKHLRQIQKNTVLVVNKIDGVDADVAAGDFYALGLGEPACIAASQGRGVLQLIDSVLAELPEQEPVEEEAISGIKLAVIGRPNVGKSTLVNRMLGEERVVVFDMPGTTRDSIYIPMERRGKHYTLIDTAGVRRRGRIDFAVEKFSVIKTLQSIEESNVVIMLMDATENLTDQDLHLLSFAINAGKSIVIAINKWDGLDTDQKDLIKREIDRRLGFADFADCHFISALHGTGVGDLFTSVDKAYASATRKISTPELNRILERAIQSHQPPLVQGRRIKLRYAHAGGQNPPIIVIHGNQVASLPDAYKRYLENTFRKALKMVGTPVRIQLKSGDNPFKDKKNQLTDSQIKKRRRLMQHVKGRKK